MPNNTVKVYRGISLSLWAIDHLKVNCYYQCKDTIWTQTTHDYFSLSFRTISRSSRDYKKIKNKHAKMRQLRMKHILIYRKSQGKTAKTSSKFNTSHQNQRDVVIRCFRSPPFPNYKRHYRVNRHIDWKARMCLEKLKILINRFPINPLNNTEKFTKNLELTAFFGIEMHFFF